MASSGAVFDDDWPSSSGLVSAYSGVYQFRSQFTQPDQCVYCEKSLQFKRITYQGSGGHVYHSCFDCAGFVYDRKTPPRLQCIRASVPLELDTPLPVLADWLEDHQNNVDADYVRKLSENTKE